MNLEKHLLIAYQSLWLYFTISITIIKQQDMKYLNMLKYSYCTFYWLYVLYKLSFAYIL